MYFVLKIKSFIKDKNMGFVAKATNVSYLLSLLKIKNPHSSLQVILFPCVILGIKYTWFSKKPPQNTLQFYMTFILTNINNSFILHIKFSLTHVHYNIYMQKNPNEQGMNLDELVLHVCYQTQSANFSSKTAPTRFKYK